MGSGLYILQYLQLKFFHTLQDRSRCAYLTDRLDTIFGPLPSCFYPIYVKCKDLTTVTKIF